MRALSCIIVLGALFAVPAQCDSNRDVEGLAEGDTLHTE